MAHHGTHGLVPVSEGHTAAVNKKEPGSVFIDLTSFPLQSTGCPPSPPTWQAQALCFAWTALRCTDHAQDEPHCNTMTPRAKAETRSAR